MLCEKENCVKIAGFVEERGGHSAPIQFNDSPGIYQYHNENILVIEMQHERSAKCFRIAVSGKNNQKLTESL